MGPNLPLVAPGAPQPRDAGAIQVGAVADIGGTVGPQRLAPRTIEGLAPLLEGQIEARTAIINRPGARAAAAQAAAARAAPACCHSGTPYRLFASLLAVLELSVCVSAL